jgi:hypothetical protein
MGHSRCKKRIGIVLKQRKISPQEVGEERQGRNLGKCDPCDNFFICHINHPVFVEAVLCACKGGTFELGPGGPGALAISWAIDTEVKGGEYHSRFAGYDR